MKMSELSAASEIPVASIKYYLREGLLPAGERTSANQASYGDVHVRRLRLIRALLDIGGLPIATARAVLAAIDTPDLPLSAVFGEAQIAISDAGLYEPLPEPTAGTAAVDEFLERVGWHVSPTNPGRHGAARVLDSYVGTGHPELAQIWEGYGRAAELIAEEDLASVARATGVESMAETVVVGTILGDALLASLRRMAQEHVSAQVFPYPVEGISE